MRFEIRNCNKDNCETGARKIKIEDEILEKQRHSLTPIKNIAVVAQNSM